MASWALHDAKARLSEVIDRALSEGPQHVTRHGRRAVVIVAAEDWERRQQATNGEPRMSFADFLLSAPQAPDGFDFELTPSNIRPRDVDFGIDDEAS